LGSITFCSLSLLCALSPYGGVFFLVLHLITHPATRMLRSPLIQETPMNIIHKMRAKKSYSTKCKICDSPIQDEYDQCKMRVYYKTRRSTCFWFDPKVLSPEPTTRENEGCEPTPGGAHVSVRRRRNFGLRKKEQVSAQLESTREKGPYLECSPRRPIWQEGGSSTWLLGFRFFAKCTLFRRWTRKGRGPGIGGQPGQLSSGGQPRGADSEALQIGYMFPLAVAPPLTSPAMDALEARPR
ncbi:hypothetical protein K438DRAFT_383824, partial [Mycena galopus ATCC 62051]